MITLILQRMGVVGAGQAANAHDTILVGDAVDGALAELRAKDLVSFPVSAVPDWAWFPFRDYVAKDLVGDFGVSGERLAEIRASGDTAEMRMAASTEGEHESEVELDYF